ncbi:MAG: VWA domain-containing protein [Bryobacterales bacterium]|nr:VWA domain-containing protein [Bryobacterales bacterium]MBV9396776.1 VWA domain-containing protein [Bryobacterales bacterium]
MKCSRRRFVLSGASIVAARVLRAQEPDDSGAIFSTGIKVVNVLATVRGKNGALINDLTKDDFLLKENGRTQTVRYFSRETDLPLSIGVLVDTSLSQLKVLEAELGASFRFLDDVVREDKDEVFVMQFDLAVMLRQYLTNSRTKLEEALQNVDTPSHHDLMLQRGGGTLLYDAVIKGAEIMRDRRNRKALILLTDGVDTGSEATLEASIDSAQRADTLIYSILFSDEGYYGLFGGGADGRHVLQRLAKETGGGFFEVSKNRPIEQIYREIQNELRSQYNLGFVSDVPVRISEFRRLQLTAKQKGLTVESRDKYWAQR